MESVGERIQLFATRLPEYSRNIERECQLDGLARCTSRRNDDDATRGPGADKRIVIRREIRVANATERRV